MIATSRTKPSTAYSGGAPATIATAAAAMATMMGSTWPMLEITAGWPAYRSFSTSASLVAAKALRSVLQKRHLRATVLMASPHTGQGLVSASMLAPLQLRFTPFARRKQMWFLVLRIAAWTIRGEESRGGAREECPHEWGHGSLEG